MRVLRVRQGRALCGWEALWDIALRRVDVQASGEVPSLKEFFIRTWPYFPREALGFGSSISLLGQDVGIAAESCLPDRLPHVGGEFRVTVMLSLASRCTRASLERDCHFKHLLQVR